MRLLMTTDTVGGVWSYTRELCTELLRRGHQIALVTLGRELSPSQRAWATAVSADHPKSFELVESALRLEWMQESAADVAESMQLVERVARRFRPDLIHSNQFCFGNVQAACPRMVVAHSDVLSWWSALRGGYPDSSPWLEHYHSVVSRGLHHADRVMAPSHWMALQVREHYELATDVEVVWNGVAETEQPEWSGKKLQAVSLGRLWDEGKNLKVILERRLNLPVLVAGETREPGTDRECDVAGGAARLLGPLGPDAVDALLRESAIYIASSRYEPFGLAPVEAAMRGCAIVASDLPSLREIWKDAAVFFDAEDSRSLDAAIDTLTADREVLRRMQMAARSRAVEHFTAARMADRYCETYTRTLARCGVAA